VEKSVKQHQKILTFPLTRPDFSLVLMFQLNTDGEDVNSLGNLQQQ